MPFTISVRDNKLVIRNDETTVEIPPSQALKEGLWHLEDEEIKTIQFQDEQHGRRRCFRLFERGRETPRGAGSSQGPGLCARVPGKSGFCAQRGPVFKLSKRKNPNCRANVAF
jgi:hypothetical protein